MADSVASAQAGKLELTSGSVSGSERAGTVI